MHRVQLLNTCCYSAARSGTVGFPPKNFKRRWTALRRGLKVSRPQGRVKGGQPLGPESRMISGKSGRTVADGPFAESKEAVGGFLQIGADSLDEAVAIAKSAPMVDFGVTIEVRPVLEECPCFKRVKEQLALATA